MNRVAFLVDGFNLYHSLQDASRDLGGATTKWLNLRALLTSHLHHIGGKSSLTDIYYFTALAGYRDARKPGHTQRHRDYMDCLRSTGVRIVLGRFKYKAVYCARCSTRTGHYEEKESDVAISVKLMELFHTDAADTIVLVTGDTDLAPAVRATDSLFPSKQVCFAFPYRRKNEDLARMVSHHFRWS